MTQFLTEHGCFSIIMVTIMRSTAPTTMVRQEAGNENAEHIFFYCHSFRFERKLLESMINERVTPDNIV